MKRYHLIKGIFGGSDVYNESGQQVGYSLPSILGDGEDFYDMEGNPVGQSFDSALGGEGFMGTDGGHVSYGFMDEEIMMGRNAWLHGDPFAKEEKPGLDLDLFDSRDDSDVGDSFDSGMDWD